MADLSITAANVVPSDGVKFMTKIAGEAIAAGKAVYLDPATDRFALADNNAGTQTVRRALGIAVGSAAAGQPVTIATDGPVAFGAVFTAGVAYYLSDTPGGICPVADLATGEYPCILGIAQSTTVLAVKVQYGQTPV